MENKKNSPEELAFIKYLNLYGKDFSKYPIKLDKSSFEESYSQFMEYKSKFVKNLGEESKIIEINRIMLDKDDFKFTGYTEGTMRLERIFKMKLEDYRLPFLLKDYEFRLKQQLGYIRQLYSEIETIGGIERDFMEEDMKEILEYDDFIKDEVDENVKDGLDDVENVSVGDVSADDANNGMDDTNNGDSVELKHIKENSIKITIPVTKAEVEENLITEETNDSAEEIEISTEEDVAGSNLNEVTVDEENIVEMEEHPSKRICSAPAENRINDEEVNYGDDEENNMVEEKNMVEENYGDDENYGDEDDVNYGDDEENNMVEERNKITEESDKKENEKIEHNKITEEPADDVSNFALSNNSLNPLIISQYSSDCQEAIAGSKMDLNSMKRRNVSRIQINLNKPEQNHIENKNEEVPDQNKSENKQAPIETPTMSRFSIGYYLSKSRF